MTFIKLEIKKRFKIAGFIVLAIAFGMLPVSLFCGFLVYLYAITTLIITALFFFTLFKIIEKIMLMLLEF